MEEREKEQQKLKKEIEEINILINDNPQVDLFYKRAQFYIQLGENAAAVNDYGAILRLDATQHYAKTQIDFLKTILRYNNTDIYASPNTNFDPWLE
jgi:hypothetical protein